MADNVKFADTLFKRMIGLLNQRSLNKGEALVFKRCNSIHTFFMRFEIDVVFTDRQNRIIKAVSRIKPWRVTGVRSFCGLCIELPVGTIASTLTCCQDTLSFI